MPPLNPITSKPLNLVEWSAIGEGVIQEMIETFDDGSWIHRVADGTWGINTSTYVYCNCTTVDRQRKRVSLIQPKPQPPYRKTICLYLFVCLCLEECLVALKKLQTQPRKSTLAQNDGRPVCHTTSQRLLDLLLLSIFDMSSPQPHSKQGNSRTSWLFPVDRLCDIRRNL